MLFVVPAFFSHLTAPVRFFFNCRENVLIDQLLKMINAAEFILFVCFLTTSTFK